MRIAHACFISFVVCIGVLARPSGAAAAGTACKLQYPIVLSHHWGTRKICPNGQCEEIEDFTKNCRNKSGSQCLEWGVPDDELGLPPRDTNMYDAGLERSMRTYHRYFSKAIVDRLGPQCLNSIFVSDKPVFASYAVRARSLRNTVLHALQQTGAAKVNIIGMSQGVQDARYLAAVLPVDDAQPTGAMMAGKIASIVSVVGEDRGAGSASLALDGIWALNDISANAWSDPEAVENAGLWDEALMDEVMWKVAATGEVVLIEGSRTALTKQAKYETFLHSMIDLTTKYMNATELQEDSFEESWDELCAFVGKPASERYWSDVVSVGAEYDNDIMYYSYAAKIRNWYSDWGDSTAFFMMWSFSGDNDSYVTVESQSFAGKGYPNFVHKKTVAGSWLGRGYHHMFFSGRNDALYQPPPAYREASPWNGSSADFYERVAIELKAAGF